MHKLKALFQSRQLVAVGMSGGIRFANAFLGLVNSALLARLLGMTGFGQYAFIYAIVMIISIPTRMGLPELVLRETAYAKRDGAPGRILGVWRWATLTASRISLLVLLIAALGSALLPDQQTLLAGLLLVPLITLGNLRSASLRGIGKVILGQLPELLLRPAFFFVVLIGLTFFPIGRQLTAIDALLINAGAALLAFIFGSLLLARSVRDFGPQTAEEFGGRKMVYLAMSLGLVAGLTVINNNIDILMIRAFMTDDDVGLYRPASGIAAFTLFGVQIINVVIVPRIASLYRADKLKQLENTVRKATRFGFAFGVLAMIVIILWGKILLAKLFGPEFQGGYYALIILSIAQAVNASFGPAASILNMSGYERRTLRAIAISVIVNLVLNALLIQLYGNNGAAISTLVAIWTYKSLLSRDIRKIIGVRSNFF